jgi:hypothetical protein
VCGSERKKSYLNYSIVFNKMEKEEEKKKDGK